MSRATADPFYVATESVTVEGNGQSFVLEKGETRLRSGHPCVKARPDLFKRDGEAEEPSSKPRRPARKPARK